MNECPHGTCDNVEKKVDKSTLKWAIVAIVMPLLLAVGGSYGVTKSQVNKVITDEAVLEKAAELGFENITNVLKEFKKDFNKRLDRMEANQVTLPQVHEAITKRLRHNNDRH